jgi:GNAT superfamily N-acetyltransferase
VQTVNRARSRVTTTFEVHLSEFYTLRRRTIKDVTALIAFVGGWFGTAPLGWPYITAGFDSGEVTKGVAIFLVAVFGGACLSGIAGLALGAIIGWTWERVHRAMRATRPPAVDATGAAPASAPASTPLVTTRARRAAAALERTTNIGAWDGTRLVGVIRVISDTAYFAAVADLLVDPEYQRRGLGRELMNRAFETTPRGSLVVGAAPGTEGFFQRVGCSAGPSGFTMKKKSGVEGSGVGG